MRKSNLSSRSFHAGRRRRYRRRKERPSPELHWGYNYSIGHIPRVRGAGPVRQGLFEPPEGTGSRLPRLHLGIGLALLGTILLNLAFWTLFHPLGAVGCSIGGMVLLFFVLRGFRNPGGSQELSLTKRH